MRFWFILPSIFGIRPVVQPEFSSRGPSSRAASEFVYVVKGDHGLAKIGVTTNPTARLATLRTASPFPIEFAYVAACSGPAIDIEQKAHAMLDRHRCRGEWFDVLPEVAIGAVAAAAAALGRDLVSVDPTEPIAPPVREAARTSIDPHVKAALIAIPTFLIFLGWLEVTKAGIDPAIVVVTNATAFAAVVGAMVALSRVIGRNG